MYKRKREKLDRFFGEGNYTAHKNGEISYKSVLNENLIIICTDHVKAIKTDEYSLTYVMYTGINKAVYLKEYQLLKGFKIEAMGKKPVFLVKLLRRYFKPYYFKEIFDPDFVEEDDYDSLFIQAKLQDKQKARVRI